MKSLVLVLLASLFIISCKEKKSSSNVPEISTASTDSTRNLPDTLTVTAVGDLMLGSNYPHQSGLPNKNILEKITPFLKDNTGIVLGNLEGTLFDRGGVPKTCKDFTLCFVFRTPVSYGKYFQEAGFDFLSIANNHSGDFGAVGRAETQKNLDSLGIRYAGLPEKCEYALKEKNGVRYAFIGAGHNEGLVSVKHYADIERIVREVRPQADIVIVMFHGGAEGVAHQHVPHRTETFVGENRGNVEEFAHVCIDAGADLVLGSGPHVTRAAELYKNKFIAYSLGNFATYGNFALKGASGKSPILKVKVGANGNFISAKIISTVQVEDTGLSVEIDPENRAFESMKNLTHEDFPNGKLQFHDGKITRK
ncbi:MAG: CapA family protein [Flavobacteriaceae bacterium]|jgi:poly-gamma-glutamate capsule biosynthesis protein CapA/YwtB (metallophosphatase superfamily)|nr:CapA family protein [Flavobacteriaceae bacterium]